MTYTITIPCRPRMVGGVDENLQWYKWCIDHGYTFVKYDKFVRNDGHPGWSWEFVKVLTDEQEKAAVAAAKKSAEEPEPIKPVPPEPVTVTKGEVEGNFWAMFLGVCIFVFVVVYMATQLWNR